MRRLKLLGLVLVAVFASAAALSAPPVLAAELPENLPELKVGEKRAWTGKNIGNVELHAEKQEPIVCTAAKGSGTEETSKPPLGTFSTTFEKCTTKAGGLVVNCTGLGDAVGIILISGTVHLVFDREIGKPFEKLTTANLFLNNAAHFTCGGLVLVDVLGGGETLCLHINPTSNVLVHEFHCIGEIAGGVPKSTELWGTDAELTAGKGKVPALLASINHAAGVPALQLGSGTVEYLVKVFADQ